MNEYDNFIERRITKMIWEYERSHNKHPNKIILGINVFEKLLAYHMCVVGNVSECGYWYYRGIKITIDQYDVNTIEVGYIESCDYGELEDDTI